MSHKAYTGLLHCRYCTQTIYCTSNGTWFHVITSSSRCDATNIDNLNAATPCSNLSETDLVAIARDEVIEKAKVWAGNNRWRDFVMGSSEINLLEAVSLLESREEIARQTEKK